MRGSTLLLHRFVTSPSAVIWPVAAGQRLWRRRGRTQRWTSWLGTPAPASAMTTTMAAVNPAAAPLSPSFELDPTRTCRLFASSRALLPQREMVPTAAPRKRRCRSGVRQSPGEINIPPPSLNHLAVQAASLCVLCQPGGGSEALVGGPTAALLAAAPAGRLAYCITAYLGGWLGSTVNRFNPCHLCGWLQFAGTSTLLHILCGSAGGVLDPA